MKISKGKLRAVVLITLLAGGLRFFAARSLYGAPDEPIYMKRAVDYARFMRTGQYDMLAIYDETYEHPALNKILFGAALLARRPIDVFHSDQVPLDRPVTESDAAPWILADRYLSVFFGTLAVLALSLVSPVAGLFLAIGTLAVKYTSLVRLEALPLLTSILCLACYLRWHERVAERPSQVPGRRDFAWLATSGFFLGLTAASKYIYCVVGIATGLHFLLDVARKQPPARRLALFVGWAAIALLAFFVFDPYLWPDPLGRLLRSVQYNAAYSQSEHVIEAGYPFWQPLRWLSDPSRFSDPSPRSALLFDLDLPIFLLALLGLPRLFHRRLFFFIWLVVALAFLLVWDTKWPPYALIAVVPMYVSAAEGLVTARDLGRKLFRSKGEPAAQNIEPETAPGSPPASRRIP